MKIIERAHIDLEKWDALVDATPDSTFFSYSWYLDAVAEEWCILINADYSSGMALPYNVRLGVKTLYTPIFVRYVEWLGNAVDTSLWLHLIKDHFKNVHLAVKTPILGNPDDQYVYQRIDTAEAREIGSQATRMLKKARKNEVTIAVTENIAPIQRIIHEELKGKIKGMDGSSMPALDRLFEAAKQQGVLAAYETAGEGGIICLEDPKKTLYLKGTVTESMKKMGGMYLAMETAISRALDKHVPFDFGGSRVEGVQKFNHHLGGRDVEYFVYKIDNAPFWFNLVRRIKNTWKK